MNHRIVWPVVAALSLAGVIAWLSQSSAQRAPGGRAGGAGEPGMPGMAGPHGMPGRFVVVNAHFGPRGEATVLILDTTTGQVYRTEEKDIKKMSELPGMGRPGGRDGRPPVREPRPEPKLDKDGRPRDCRPPEKDARKNDEDARRPDRDPRPPVKDAKEKDDVRSTPKDQAPSRREEK